MQIVQFETRGGQKFTVEVVGDIGHALSCKVLKGGGKGFVGKTLLFAKNDMLNVKQAA